MKNLKIITIVITLFFCGEALSQVQWRGPARDGKYSETGLMKEWPAKGPELLLKMEGLGGGYSTPVMADDIIYITGRRDSLEYLTAVTLEGETLWETMYGKAWMKSFQETRNTPAIEDGKVFIAGTMGTVNCIDAKSGEILWANNPSETYNAKFHRWGTAESLVLTENAVIASPSGEQTVMVALDKADGSLIWKSEPTGGGKTYVSPLLVKYNGIGMLLATTSKELVGINADNGKILWQFDILADFTSRKGSRNSTNTPLFKDGEIFFSSGYNDKSLMLKLSEDATSVSLKWTDTIMDNHHGGMVLVDGYIYGANWISNGKGNWVCLDWATGELMFEEKWNNKGSIIWADDMFYILEEKLGNVGIFPVSNEGLVEKGSFKVDDGRGPRWAHPSIYDRKLLIRHHDVLLVYDIKARG